MPDSPVLPRLNILTQNQLNLSFRAAQSPVWRCRTKLHYYNFSYGLASLRTWSPRRKNILINKCFQIQADTDNIIDEQYCCSIITTSQNTSACKNRHPLGWVQEIQVLGLKLMCSSHNHGVYAPHRHHHKPGPAEKMALLLQEGCLCSVTQSGIHRFLPWTSWPPWDQVPTKDQAEMPCRDWEKKQQLLGGAVRSQDWACSRDRRHNNSHDFCCLVIYRHKNVDHLATQSELPNRERDSSWTHCWTASRGSGYSLLQQQIEMLQGSSSGTGRCSSAGIWSMLAHEPPTKARW